MEPDRALNHERLGLLLLKNGQVDEAIAEFREVLKAQPSNANAHTGLALILIQQRKFEDAIEALLTLFRLHPEYVNSYKLACAYALNGDKDKAFEWLSKAAQAGWKNTALMATDPNMDSLRDDPRYAEIIELMEGKKE